MLKTQKEKSIKYNSLDELLAHFKEEKYDIVSSVFREIRQFKKLNFFKQAFVLATASCLISLAIIFIF